MNGKVTSLRKSIGDFVVRHGISGEMEQNLLKEAIHLHLLSALSDAGILRYVVFQGGTALRLCYGGERYSEDLDFVCGKSGSWQRTSEMPAAHPVAGDRGRAGCAPSACGSRWSFAGVRFSSHRANAAGSAIFR
jgi:hypothetical protein